MLSVNVPGGNKLIRNKSFRSLKAKFPLPVDKSPSKQGSPVVGLLSGDIPAVGGHE